jgi:hypothetical protein
MLRPEEALPVRPEGLGELRANAVTITIYVAANCNYPFFVPGQVGYDTVFEKTALHEVGHTMGLKDVGNGTCTGTGYGISVMDRFPCVADDTHDHSRLVQSSQADGAQ